jgi:predicted NUDIX family phosphoesterase
MVIPYEKIKRIDNRFSTAHYDQDILSGGQYAYRCDVEACPALQQVAPFAVVVNKSSGACLVSRDNDKLKLVIAGRISPQDRTYGDPLSVSLLRTVDEEVQLSGIAEPKWIGYIKDGSGYFGVGFELNVAEAVIAGQEKFWWNLDMLVKQYGLFDNWSKYVIDHYYLKNKEAH